DLPTLSSLRKVVTPAPEQGQGSILARLGRFSSEKQPADLFGRPRKQGSSGNPENVGTGNDLGVGEFATLFPGIGIIF
ncbi:MAG: hypothetical protein AAF471_05885, partial [Myxococcota bacterium]